MARQERAPDPSDIVEACAQLAERFREVAAESHHLVLTGPSPAAAFLWAASAWSASKDAEQDKSLEDHTSYERLSHYFQNHMDSILSRKRKVDELHIETKLFGFTNNADELHKMKVLRHVLDNETIQWPQNWPHKFQDSVTRVRKDGSKVEILVNCSISFHDARLPSPPATYLRLPQQVKAPSSTKIATLNPITLLSQSLLQLQDTHPDNYLFYGEGPVLDSLFLLTVLLDVVVDHRAEFPAALNGFPIDRVVSHRALVKIIGHERYESLSRWVGKVKEEMNRKRFELEHHNGSQSLVRDMKNKLAAFSVAAEFFPVKLEDSPERDTHNLQHPDQIYFPVYPSSSYAAVSRSA